MTKELKNNTASQKNAETPSTDKKVAKSKGWERSYHQDDTTVAALSYSRVSRIKQPQEATLLSKVLLGIIVLAVLVPIFFWIWMSANSSRAKVTPRTADNVIISKNAESKTNAESSSSKQESATQNSESASSGIARQIVPASQTASRTSVAEPVSRPAEPTYTEPEPAAPSGGTYVVQAGDSWYAIATRNGVDVYALVQANGASLETAIFPGQTIYLP